MSPTKPTIFLSYARQDKDRVEELYQKLSDARFHPWMDVKDIHAGEDWKIVLIKVIRESHFFVACLSNNSVRKRGVIQEELKEASDVWRQKLEDDIYFIPVRLEECEVPESMSRFQWVDLFEDDGFEKLENAIKEGLKRIGIISDISGIWSGKRGNIRLRQSNDVIEGEYDWKGSKWSGNLTGKFDGEIIRFEFRWRHVDGIGFLVYDDESIMLKGGWFFHDECKDLEKTIESRTSLPHPWQFDRPFCELTPTQVKNPIPRCYGFSNNEEFLNFHTTPNIKLSVF